MATYNISALVFDHNRERITEKPVYFSINSDSWRTLRPALANTFKRFREVTGESSVFVRFINAADRNKKPYYLTIHYHGPDEPHVLKFRNCEIKRTRLDLHGVV